MHDEMWRYVDSTTGHETNSGSSELETLKDTGQWFPMELQVLGSSASAVYPFLVNG